MERVSDPEPELPEARVIAPLSYAPLARDPRRAIWVIVAGMTSSLVTLLTVVALDVLCHFSMLGLYIKYVFPIGAIIVGVCAGIGYGIGSLLTGVRILRGLLWTIVALQLLAYGGAKYMEFRAQGPLVTRTGRRPVGFFAYYHAHATGFVWRDSQGDTTPLGGAGYLIRLLEMLAFVGSGTIAPIAMMDRPYCDLCQMYKRRKRLLVLAASAPNLKAPGSEHEAVARSAKQSLEHLTGCVASDDADSFNTTVADLHLQHRSALKRYVRIEINLEYCRNCHSGTLRPTMTTGGGGTTNRRPLPIIALQPTFVVRIISKPRAGAENKGAENKGATAQYQQRQQPWHATSG